MKMKKHTLFRRAGLAAFTLCALTPLTQLSATTFLHESFITKASPVKTNGEYRLDNQLIAAANKDVAGGDIVGFSSANAWDGNSQNPRTVTTGLTSNSIRSAGGSVQFRGASSVTNRFVHRSVSNYTPAPSLFFSASMSASMIDTSTVSLVAFTDAATNDRANNILNNTGDYYLGLAVGFVGNGTGMDLVVRYRDDALAYVDHVLLNNVSADTTYTIIGQIDWNAAADNRDPFTIWVNPGSATLPSGGVSLVGFLGESDSIKAVHLLQKNFGSGLNDAVYFDELRLASSYSDLGVIPEPSTTSALVGGAVLALLVAAKLRRRA